MRCLAVPGRGTSLQVRVRPRATRMLHRCHMAIDAGHAAPQWWAQCAPGLTLAPGERLTLTLEVSGFAPGRYVNSANVGSATQIPLAAGRSTATIVVGQ